MPRQRVMITGAAGRVGRVLTRAWRDTYDLTLVDVHPIGKRFGARAVVADVRDEAAMLALCRDQDVVVHLAIEGNLDAPPEQLAPVNLTGTRKVMQAAAAAGCRRLVYASSLAIDLYPERDYSRVKLETEGWARRIAGSTSLSIHCLRLGRVLPPDHWAIWPDNKDLDFVLTYGDMTELFTRSINAPAEIHFGVFNGISGNEPASHPIAYTRDRLCYAPKDNAHELARLRFRSPGGLLRRILSRLGRSWS